MEVRRNNREGQAVMKQFRHYFGWSILIILILFIGTEIRILVKEYQSTYYNPFPHVLFITFFPIIMGAIIRLPQFVTENTFKKKWSVDWIRFYAIVIPFLLLALTPLLIYVDIPITLGNLKREIILSGFLAPTIAGLISGYVMLDCLKAK
jgi:hypothetical protein